MSRIPSLKPRQLVAALLRLGFQSQRQTGSHHILTHPQKPNTVVPMHNKELKRATLLGILKQAKVSEEELLKALD